MSGFWPIVAGARVSVHAHFPGPDFTDKEEEAAKLYRHASGGEHPKAEPDGSRWRTQGDLQ